MISPLQITSLSQGKLHKNHEELWAEVSAQQDAFQSLVQHLSLRPVLKVLTAMAHAILNPWRRGTAKRRPAH